MQVRCFSTTSTLLKSITPHKATGVLYTDSERLALTLPADLGPRTYGPKVKGRGSLSGSFWLFVR
jgi:hypothetical protein